MRAQQTSQLLPQELQQLKQLLEKIRTNEDVEYSYREIVEILHFISSAPEREEPWSVTKLKEKETEKKDVKK